MHLIEAPLCMIELHLCLTCLFREHRLCHQIRVCLLRLRAWCERRLCEEKSVQPGQHVQSHRHGLGESCEWQQWRCGRCLDVLPKCPPYHRGVELRARTRKKPDIGKRIRLAAARCEPAGILRRHDAVSGWLSLLPPPTHVMRHQGWVEVWFVIQNFFPSFPGL